eukprot:TRINITY_DN475_c0_g5_i1.p1 TRINITY_DN475_c0_g5~~TRINITY_DN475_c0_g5_i1.p1  ORF type:complete len:132 (-),score=63.33 TRINITY_DN475_c0_g5_i1:677-1072(-)
MSRIYYRGAKAAIVCYDLTNKVSFSKVRFWVEELRTNEKNCDIYIIGTKLDRVLEDNEPRGIDAPEIQNYANEIGAHALETSSKTGYNIDNLFFRIAEDFIKKNKQTERGYDQVPLGGTTTTNPQPDSCSC